MFKKCRSFFVLIILINIINFNIRESKIKPRKLSESSNLVFKFPKCSKNSDCSGHGVCDMSTGNCICDSGYVSYINTDKYDDENMRVGADNIYIDLNSNNFKMCNYKLKKQLTALMLSIFVGFGSEHFYLGHHGTGAGKFCFYIFCYYMNIGIVVFYIFFKNKRHYIDFIGMWEAVYMVLGFIFMIFWNLRDWIMIGKNTLLDVKGNRLHPW